ncbi:MAG: hypothetical protein R2764_00045, partial [Bacteroidales bacterium]
MKNKIKFWSVLALIITFFLGCSKDDGGTKTQLLNGGTVKTYEVVIIEKENINNETYEAIFNGNSIVLNKIDDNQVAFIVTPDIALFGELNLLEIPALNLEIQYNVLNTTLVETPEETMQPFIDMLNNVETSSVDQGVKIQLFIDSFMDYYNNLSDIDKQMMAVFYLANEGLFVNSLNITGKSIQSSVIDSLDECQTYTYATGAFGVLAAVSSGPMPIISILCSAGAVVSFKNAIETCGTFADQNIKNTFVQAENEIFETEKHQTSTEIVFNDMVTKTVSFSLGMRAVNTADSDDNNSYISIFFQSINKINNIIQNKLNTAIVYYNQNVPYFLEIEPFDTIAINDATVSEQMSLTEEMFNSMSFSIPNNNITIETLD